MAFAPGVAHAATLQVFSADAIHFWRLDSGLRVVLKEDHSAPVAAINVIVRAGSGAETAKTNGIAHFLEHMVFRAARVGGSDSLSAPIEAVGGVINGGTLRDFAHYSAVVPAPHFGLALDALAKSLIRPVFEPAAVATERAVLAREAQQLADQPAAASWEAAYQLAYGAHPYARPMSGAPATIAAIDAGALAAFHRRLYVPRNTSLVIVGDIRPDEARAAVAAAFGKWRGDAAPTRRPPLPALNGPRERVITRQAPRATVTVAFRAIGISQPRQVCAADLLLALIGEGYTSRLKRALVDAGLADQFSVSFLTQAVPGLFGVQATCAPEGVQAVRRAIEDEATRLGADPVSDDDLATAKQRVVCSYAFRNETFEDQAATLGFYEAIATYEFAVTYLDRVRSLTAGELQAVARACLDSAHEVAVVVTPGVCAQGAPSASAARGQGGAP
jgi:zinc protease